MGAMRGADDAMPWLPFTLPPAQLEGSFTRSDDGWYAPGPGPPPPPGFHCDGGRAYCEHPGEYCSGARRIQLWEGSVATEAQCEARQCSCYDFRPGVNGELIGGVQLIGYVISLGAFSVKLDDLSGACAMEKLVG